MSVVGLDFSTLSVRDALDLAVLIEEEARDRYRELADQLTLHHTPEAAAFFTRMARVEERHRQQLLRRRELEFGDQPGTMSRRMIFDVEASEYDEARAFMTLRQALEVALRAENKAHDFYCKVADAATDPKTIALFRELQEEEVDHRTLVQAELGKLPPDKGSGDAFADEPQAL